MIGRDFNMSDISIVNGKVLTTQELYDSLEEVGVKKGDVICVHSHLMAFGKPLLKRQDFMNLIIDTLNDVIGENGTLIMPTFTYSFCNKENYDMQKSPSTVGILTEYYRKYPNIERTWHPIFSFAIGGNRQKEYLDIGPDAFSLDSVYGKMIRDNGKLIMLGGNYGYTFYYLAEEHVNVRHRYFKNFSGEIITPQKNYITEVPYFVRNLTMRSELDEEKLAKYLIETRYQKQVAFAKGTLAAVECKDMYNCVCNILRTDQERFL